CLASIVAVRSGGRTPPPYPPAIDKKQKKPNHFCVFCFTPKRQIHKQKKIYKKFKNFYKKKKIKIKQQKNH
ncbi:hypothetical protein ACVGWG_08140, partial [Enterobacter asburiae]